MAKIYKILKAAGLRKASLQFASKTGRSLLWLALFVALFVACKGTENSGANSQDASKAGHDSSAHATESYYTCSMHPQVKEEEPGKCPICHMNLTKVEVTRGQQELPATSEEEEEQNLWQCQDYPQVKSLFAEDCPLDGTPMVKVSAAKQKERAGDVVARVQLRKAQLRHFRAELFPVTPMRMQKRVRLLGTVLPSEEKESSLPARVAGRVEKVYVRSVGSHIRRGDPVVDIYSPTLISGGEEYLVARENYEKDSSPEFAKLFQQSRERLRLWGVRPFQLESWYKKKIIPRAITLYSTVTGVVQKRHATVGKYFREGENLFELSNLRQIWVEMDVYEQDSSYVQPGQLVKLDFIALPGEKYSGLVDFVSPVLNPQSRTLKIRTTIDNTQGALKPGMLADATLIVEMSEEPLVVPRAAIIDTGKRKVVWVKSKTEDVYVAQRVETGFESEGYVEVREGLQRGDEVVLAGNFLLDAQAQLFGGYQDFRGQGGAHSHH